VLGWQIWHRSESQSGSRILQSAQMAVVAYEEGNDWSLCNFAVLKKAIEGLPDRDMHIPERHKGVGNSS